MMNELKVFKGIEYIQLDELPLEQQELMISTINTSLFIKIMIDGKIISQCLQYRDYSKWYDQKNKTVSSTLSSSEVADERVSVETNLAVK